MLRRLAPFPILAFATLMLVAPRVARAAGPADLYYERTLMARAGSRCALFDPRMEDALAASARQARGAALRGGADPAGLASAGGRATAKADAVACDSPDLKRAAARVRAGFAGWASLRTMHFPGQRSAWDAQRVDRPKAPLWTLSTPFRAADAPAVLGLTSADGGDALTAVVSPALAGAYAVRLVLRDPATAPEPYLDRSGAPPPAAASRAILAAARGEAPPSLAPKGVAVASLVRFGPAATQALAQLDPRESARLEWVFPAVAGDRVVSVLIEAGDFAAGRAFLAVGR